MKKEINKSVFNLFVFAFILILIFMVMIWPHIYPVVKEEKESFVEQAEEYNCNPNNITYDCSQWENRNIYNDGKLIRSEPFPYHVSCEFDDLICAMKHSDGFGIMAKNSCNAETLNESFEICKEAIPLPLRDKIQIIEPELKCQEPIRTNITVDVNDEKDGYDGLQREEIRRIQYCNTGVIEELYVIDYPINIIKIKLYGMSYKDCIKTTPIPRKYNHIYDNGKIILTEEIIPEGKLLIDGIYHEIDESECKPKTYHLIFYNQ